jgi:hypothetical protein
MRNLYQRIARHGIFYAIAGAMLVGSGCGGCGEKIHGGFEAVAKLDPTYDEKTKGGFGNKTFVEGRDGLVEKLKENNHDGRASWIERRGKKRDRILSGQEAPQSLWDILPDWGWGDNDDNDDGESQSFGEWVEENLSGIFEGGSSSGGTGAGKTYVGNEKVLAAVTTLYTANKPYVDANPNIKVSDKVLIALMSTEAGQHIARGDTNIESPTGAKGPCQFVGSTAYKYDLCDKVTSNGGTYYCVNIDHRDDAEKAIPAMGLLMTELYDHYEGHTERDRVLLAYGAYNAGEAAIDYAIADTGKGTSATWEDVMSKLNRGHIKKAYKGRKGWGYFKRGEKVEEIRSHGARANAYLELQETAPVPTTDPSLSTPVE